MPDLNLKDEEEFSRGRGGNVEKTRKSRFHAGGGGGNSSNTILLIAIVVLIALGVVMLNQFGVIHLWGTGTSPVVVELPPLEEEEVPPILEPTEPNLTQLPEQVITPVPDDRPALGQREEPRERPRELRPAGTGMYTVQVSAWRDRSKAETQVQRIRAAGKDAYVDQTTINGTTWYRVRIGRYNTREEAENDARGFQLLLETGWWVARIDN